MTTSCREELALDFPCNVRGSHSLVTGVTFDNTTAAFGFISGSRHSLLEVPCTFNKQSFYLFVCLPACLYTSMTS